MGEAKPIPAHVAAYAAGLRAASRIKGRAMPWPAIARLLGLMGFGRFTPYDVEIAATAWSTMHVEPGAISSARRRARR
jgi:hypothetical protein